jgi:XTP/dITP diphosphohydrolase
MKLIIASNNQGKVREFKQLLQPLGYEVISQSEAGISISVEETGKTFEDNARLKAKAIFDIVGNGVLAVPPEPFAVLADDSGLEVDALGGAPGVDTANFNIPWLLEKMQGVEKADRTARFVCCICYIDSLYMRKVKETCEGWIGLKERGENGFGYDPIFMVKNKSFAQLPDDQKNAISHRGKALRKLVEELK